MSTEAYKPYERAMIGSLHRTNDPACRRLIVRNYRGARHIWKSMITIRQPKAGSKLTLVSLEAILTTPRNVYAISSGGPMIEPESSYDGALFGAISWPVSRFRVADGLLLEQQMFLPHEGSAVAISWSLRGDTAIDAQLVVKPFFSGCAPRAYRDVGFHFDSEDNCGRLTWLPNVRGPRLSADTNGRYHDEPVRLFDCVCEQAASASAGDVITPGRFEFELSRRPAILILSMEDSATIQHNQHIGVFLAGLMQENTSAVANSAARESTGVKIQHPPNA